MPAAPDFPPAPDRVPVRRALISVSDKTGLVEAARALAEGGVELVSTGGTRAAIAAAGLAVKDVSDLTGFPEMMDGRVKTLHPVVHGGLLGVRDAPAHAAAMAEHGIGGIDLVYVNLYPFEKTVAGGGDFASAIENIDIGGPAMIRSAAKNHGYVAVCTELEDLQEVLAELAAEGTTSLVLRKTLAARAYARTAAYDAAIALMAALPPPLPPAHGNSLGAAWMNRGHALHQLAGLAPDRPDLPAAIVAAHRAAIATLSALPADDRSVRINHAAAWLNLANALLLPAAAGTLTHLLCDNCTSYGTMLLWPFSEARFSWDCLPIIDLLATLPLLVLAILAWRRHKPRLAAYGLLWFSAYALAGVWQQRRAEQGVRDWLATQGVAPAKLAVKPTISNLLAWRAIWLHEGRWQVAVVRVTPFGGRQLLLGETRDAWTPASAGNPPPFSPGAHIIADFSVFTQGWNTYDRADGAILVGDIRFAMLPTSSRPLWSVRCAPGGTLADTTLVMDRSIRDGDWGRLGALLSGSEPRFIEIE
jgi:hypothetical protein